MLGKICLHEHLWGPSPFLVRWGAEVARRADRDDAHEGFTQLRAARMRKTLLLLCGLYCVLSRERWCYSTLEPLASLDVNECPPPLCCAWASFYMLKGSPTGGNVSRGKTGKALCWVQLPVQCYHT